MTPHALLFTLAAIGVAETAYLIRKRYEGVRPVCPIGESCHIVLESKYNQLFGVHNDIFGLLFYVAISFVTAFLVVEVEPVETWVFIAQVMIGLAAIMSLVLVFIQWKVLKAWCFWCVMSALTVLFMGIIVLVADLILT